MITSARRELRKNERHTTKSYSKLRKSYCKLLHFTKCPYYHKTITASKDNIKAFYKITDNLLVKKNIPSCDSDAQSSKDFSNFFNAKVVPIHKKINANNIHPPPLPV